MQMIKFVPTLAEIREFHFAGNHLLDGGKFTAISKFIHSEAPMAEKQEALLRMQRDGMGYLKES